jgi:hypothetical protein
LYVLIHLTEYYPDNARPKYALDAKVELLADQFAKYLDLAIGGELRHYIRCSDRIERDERVPETASRSAAWMQWKGIREQHGITALKLAVDLFGLYDWKDSYGGPSWANIAQALIEYETGEWTKLMFIDQVFSLKHNGGPVFSKVWDTTYLMEVLDANLHSNIPYLVRKSSDKVVDMVRDIDPSLIVRERIPWWQPWQMDDAIYCVKEKKMPPFEKKKAKLPELTIKENDGIVKPKFVSPLEGLLIWEKIGIGTSTGGEGARNV